MSAPSENAAEQGVAFDPTNFPVLRRKLIRYFSVRDVRPPDDEECADETLFRVHLKIASGERIESLNAYALGVALNVFREYCRDPTRHMDSLSDKTPEPMTPAPGRDLVEPLLIALQSLPAKEQKLLRNYYASDDHAVDRQKLARRLGMSPNALYVTMRRIRRKLFEILKEQGYDSLD